MASSGVGNSTLGADVVSVGTLAGEVWMAETLFE